MAHRITILLGVEINFVCGTFVSPALFLIVTSFVGYSDAYRCSYGNQDEGWWVSSTTVGTSAQITLQNPNPEGKKKSGSSI